MSVTTWLIRWGKFFLLSSVSTGILFGFFMALRFGVWNGVVAGALWILMWGPAFTLSLAAIDAFARRHLPGESAHSYQKRKLQVFGSPEAVFERVQRALVDLPMFLTMKTDQRGLAIEGRTCASWASFGESVRVQVEPEGEGVSRITITSQPRIKITTVDYGKNWKNVETITTAIRRAV